MLLNQQCKPLMRKKDTTRVLVWTKSPAKVKVSSNVALKTFCRGHCDINLFSEGMNHGSCESKTAIVHHYSCCNDALSKYTVSIGTVS